MKKLLIAIIVVVLVGSMVMPVFAATNAEIMPRYDYVNTIHASLTIDKTWGIATCTGKIAAKSLIPVEVDVRLQMYKGGYWQTLKEWSATGTRTASSSSKYAIARGYKYRVSSTGYVYDTDGNIIEVVSAIHTVEYS